ncbi:MAG: undecaprenyl-diphosphate phosphatase [Alphaproteobacteria bacterium]
MPLNILILFALVQGVTEFLPVSSSGHLQLIHAYLNQNSQQIQPIDLLTLEVAAHAGTLLAVLAYCARDLLSIARDTLKTIKQKKPTPGAKLLIILATATIPLFLAGWLLHELIATHTRNVLIIVAIANLTFAILLAIADRLFLRVRQIQHLKIRDAIFIGIFQAIALIPGVSRSGAVITAARMLSCERQDAAKLSLLLSIPAILGASAVLWTQNEQINTPPNQIFLLATLSFAVALPAIILLMKWVQRASYNIFVIYRLLFSALLFAWIGGLIPQ